MSLSFLLNDNATTIRLQSKVKLLKVLLLGGTMVLFGELKCIYSQVWIQERGPPKENPSDFHVFYLFFTVKVIVFWPCLLFPPLWPFTPLKR